MGRKLWTYIKDTVQVVFFALLLTFILRNYVVEARIIPSGSMLPTLQIGDRLLVDKILYKFNDISRGDIVIFSPPPEARAAGAQNDLIKRVIGLPGETVEITKGTVYINGIPLEENYIAQKPGYTYGPVTVPEGALFVLGDNRNNSFDSHAWGFVPVKTVKGEAFLRFWPPNRIGLISPKR